MLPKVTVIIPTTLDRKDFNRQITEDFLSQDYENKTALFDYGNENVGVKRNRLCKIAPGDIIVHFDSDDNYKPDWIKNSVAILLCKDADITGLKAFNMYSQEHDASWTYDYGNGAQPFVTGATMCYWKKYWRGNPFQEIEKGEDVHFVYGTNSLVKPKVYAHGYIEGFLCSMHGGNTSQRDVWKENGKRYRRHSEEEMKVLKGLWGLAEKP